MQLIHAVLATKKKMLKRKNDALFGRSPLTKIPIKDLKRMGNGNWRAIFLGLRQILVGRFGGSPASPFSSRTDADVSWRGSYGGLWRFHADHLWWHPESQGHRTKPWVRTGFFWFQPFTSISFWTAKFWPSNAYTGCFRQLGRLWAAGQEIVPSP